VPRQVVSGLVQIRGSRDSTAHQAVAYLGGLGWYAPTEAFVFLRPAKTHSLGVAVFLS
jgi:hypothetical protein